MPVKKVHCMTSKRCTKCGTVKPLDGFCIAKRMRDGRTSWCRQCYAERNRPPAKRKKPRPPGYTVWIGMMIRCNNPKSQAYDRYGGRGIKVHPTWQGRGGFEHFIAYMGQRPSPEHQIDRIDNDGNYEPGNVRWATAKQNSRNRRTSRHLTVNGETRTIAEWAEIIGCHDQRIRHRVNLGWSDEEAVYGRFIPSGRIGPDGQPGWLTRALRGLVVGDTVFLASRPESVHVIKKRLGIKARTFSHEGGTVLRRLA